MEGKSASNQVIHLSWQFHWQWDGCAWWRNISL